VKYEITKSITLTNHLTVIKVQDHVILEFDDTSEGQVAREELYPGDLGYEFFDQLFQEGEINDEQS
jgi:hypothetical protein